MKPFPLTDNERKKFKLCVIDIDGTLSEKDDYVSPRIISKIKELDERGIHICVSTGRNKFHALPVVKKLGVEKLYSTVDGIKSFLPKSDVPVFQNVPRAGVFRDILEIISNEEVYFEIAADDCYYKYPNRATEFDYGLSFDDDRAIRFPRFEDLYEKADDGNVLIIGAKKEAQKRIMSNIYEKYGDEIKIRDGIWEDFLFISAPEVGKATSLRQAAEYYNVKIEETVAIGDSFNDLDMISEAGFGVAMGNVHERVLEIADWETETIQNDGVAVALEMIFG